MNTKLKGPLIKTEAGSSQAGPNGLESVACACSASTPSGLCWRIISQSHKGNSAANLSVAILEHVRQGMELPSGESGKACSRNQHKARKAPRKTCTSKLHLSHTCLYAPTPLRLLRLALRTCGNDPLAAKL